MGIRSFEVSACYVLSAIGIFAPKVHAQTESPAINYVVASQWLHTSGQPDSEQLGTLADRGFDLVINLAPPTSPNSVSTEGQLVAETGTAYVNIPVDWRAPSYADFEFFSGILNQSRHDQVLVHCMLNYRASMFTFLYRAVHQGIEREQAYEAVAAVWEPQEQWVEFGQMVLDRHGVNFQLQ